MTSCEARMEGAVFVAISTLICLAAGHWSDEKFDYFVYAQAWPPGTCALGKHEGHTCSVPNSIKTWLVHGLWPALKGRKGPFNCANTPFDMNKLATIKARMEMFWPDLYSDTAHDSFWEHEWRKHGTCCEDLSATSTELKYFTEGLKLNQIFNISSMLSRSNIVPSPTAQYKFEDFINAIKKVTGFEPTVECAHTKLPNETDYHLIEQIQICLDKTFKPVTCDQGRGTGRYGMGSWELVKEGPLRFIPWKYCPKHEHVYYPPITYA